MLDTDLMTCDKSKILGTKILGTWVNGERVWGK
jgi:predicted amidohydrolase YtcJ